MTSTMEVLIVPAQRTISAPSYANRDKLGFDEVVCWRTSNRVMLSLLALGVGEEPCPTIGEWVAFAIAGGVIATATGKQIQFPQGHVPEDLEKRTWELLWEFIGEDRATDFCPEFRAAILRGFLPRFHHSPPDRPYSRTEFVDHWVYEPQAYPFMSSVGKLTKEGLSWGKEGSLAKLPPEVVEDIKRAALHIRASTDYAIECIRAKYRW